MSDIDYSNIAQDSIAALGADDAEQLTIDLLERMGYLSNNTASIEPVVHFEVDYEKQLQFIADLFTGMCATYEQGKYPEEVCDLIYRAEQVRICVDIVPDMR